MRGYSTKSKKRVGSSKWPGRTSRSSSPIVVDTSQGAHLLETSKSLRPYVRWEVVFRIEHEEEIGPQLRTLGIGPRDVNRVLLTHLHMDYYGGLAHFHGSEILVRAGQKPESENFTAFAIDCETQRAR